MQRCGLPEQSSLVVRLRTAAQGGELEAVTGYCAASSSPPCFGALARPRHFKLAAGASREGEFGHQAEGVYLSLSRSISASLSLSLSLSLHIYLVFWSSFLEREREIWRER